MSIDLSKLITASEKLKKLKESKIAALSTQCRDAITAGFESDALGDLHLYPSKETDQLNLAGSVTDSLLPDLPSNWTTPFWCADAAGEWAMRPHTAAQIQQVGREAKARILMLMQHNAQLAEQVQFAPDKQSVDEVIWDYPAA
ncbi:hypothetical protein [Alcaligenes endophyticus]|uniref:DUF4376 domain-containing protein n=1 Tax=Alcaligenes endophyticus TaxID=1929088 RepID=A0ABT8EKA5_9BURK|nr:hypothetical protein [Alcaligenes endophyticus]MCX5592012.1 hypothetical protein [Alcaligenes endophyticus]MDN4121702.1 hypothetical protein [Alcaligenes endophyticus]